MLLSLLLISFVSIVTVRGSRSCSLTGGVQSESQYKKLCCNSSNRGQRFTIDKSEKITLIICPKELPSSCKKGRSSTHL